jgi:hypothetical protein
VDAGSHVRGSGSLHFNNVTLVQGAGNYAEHVPMDQVMSRRSVVSEAKVPKSTA